ncbi:CYTH domain protein, partial [Haemophilus influenzae]
WRSIKAKLLQANLSNLFVKLSLN